RPSNKSASVSFPSGPSKTYSFSTFTIGSLRRAALSASRCRENSFSRFNKSFRATSHSAADTTSVGFSASFIFRSFRLLGCFSKKFLEGQHSHASARCRTSGGSHQSHACHTRRTHWLRCSFLPRLFIRFLQIRGQAIERSLPEFTILLDPLRRLFQWPGLQLHFVNTPIAPITLAPKQSRFFQHSTVF